MPNYIYQSPSHDGWRNLAADQYFLETLCPEDILLYFYVNENAVIVGKNQNAWKECDLDAMERDGVQLVRRHTGGGAVYHDRGNLNFSFIMAEQHYDVARQLRVVCNAVRSFGLEAVCSGRNDILIGEQKFSGNAFAVQKSMRGHHGTLLVNADLGKLSGYLNVSPKKIASKGIASVRSRVCNLAELCPGISVEALRQALIAAFIEEYDTAEPYELPASAEPRLQELYQAQASWEWRLGKAPKFDYTIEERLSFGEVQLLFSLQQGRVAAIQVFSDALDTQFCAQVQQALQGCRFDAAELAQALSGCEGQALQELAEYLRALAL